MEWQGVDEKGFDSKTGKSLVEIDTHYFRPTEVDTLLGDASKAKRKLGWEPKISFEELVSEMVREDLKLAERDSLCEREGFKSFNQHE
jgi:GDPmannose 4,6-dehydratase